MHILFQFISVLLPTFAIAATWEPNASAKQIRIWPGPPPGGATSLNESLGVSKRLVGGKLYHYIENVSTPTMTIYRPVKPNGSAIVVFPGGGHTVLAIDIEGSEVCEWLNQHSITCVLVKYRVPRAGCYYDAASKKHITPPVPMALQDAQRTISTIRSRAKELGIDAGKIGVMGFSAGGNVAVLTSTAFAKRSYSPIDATDQVSCRPDFALPIFPGHLTMEHKNKTPKRIAAQELNTDIVLTSEVPPQFIVHALDDDVNPVHYSQVYYRELKKAGVKAQLNLYKTGGHAFGVRQQGKDTDRWPTDALTWMKQIGVL